MKGTFNALDPNAEIFQRIEKDKPQWWEMFCSDPDLYIDIRKDNYINIYYLGGSIARIKYKNGFNADIHHKYLGEENLIDKPYSSLNLEKLDNETLSRIKRRIEENLSNSNNEHPSEKRIQGELITKNSDYIDSEFQYNQDAKIGKLRIDLVKLKNRELSFIELKRIIDKRLRNDEQKNKEEPEIIKQMDRYQSFINTYENQLYDFYKRLIQIKQNLGLLTRKDAEFKINLTPKLIIVNTYKANMTLGQKNRVNAIKELLNKERICFEIINWK